MLHQLCRSDCGIVNIGSYRINYLSQIVRGDTGAHSHRNSLSSVYQKVRHPDGKNLRLLLRFIIIGNEIYGLIQIL